MVHTTWTRWIQPSPHTRLHPIIIVDVGSIYFTAIQHVLLAHDYLVRCINPDTEPIAAIIAEVAATAPSLILLGAWLDRNIIAELVQGSKGAWPLIIIVWDESDENLSSFRTPHADGAAGPILSSSHDLEEFFAHTLRW